MPAPEPLTDHSGSIQVFTRHVEVANPLATQPPPAAPSGQRCKCRSCEFCPRLPPPPPPAGGSPSLPLAAAAAADLALLGGSSSDGASSAAPPEKQALATGVNATIPVTGSLEVKGELPATAATTAAAASAAIAAPGVLAAVDATLGSNSAAATTGEVTTSVPGANGSDVSDSSEASLAAKIESLNAAPRLLGSLDSEE